MVTTQLSRKFIWNKGSEQVDLDDPNQDFTANEVLDFYSIQHPELTTAKVSGPEIKEDARVYTFSTVLGTKG